MADAVNVLQELQCLCLVWLRPASEVSQILVVHVVENRLPIIGVLAAGACLAPFTAAAFVLEVCSLSKTARAVLKELVTEILDLTLPAASECC